MASPCMNVRRTLRVIVIAIGLLAGAGLTHAEPTPGKHLGETFPDFTFTDVLTGETVSLSEFRGKVVLLSFWRSNHAGCAAQLVHIKRAYLTYHERGLAVINVSLDEAVDEAREYILLKGIPGRHAVEGGGWDTRLARELGVLSVPELFVLDHDGVCIEDEARGTALPRVIRRAVRGVPESVRERSDPSGTAQNPTVVRALEERIERARSTIDTVGRPLVSIHDRLDEVIELIDWIESQYPHPERVQLVRIRFERIITLMREVRLELFMAGYLNDRDVQVPMSPFEQYGVDPSTEQLAVVERQLAPTRRAAIVMRLAMSGTWSHLQDTDSDLREVRRRLGWGRSDLEELTGKIDEIEKIVAVIRSRATDPWRRQLASIDDVLGRLAGTDTALLATLSELEERLAFCRRRLPIATRRPAAFIEVRDAYADLRVRLQAVIDELEDRGVVQPGAATLPPDPFERVVQVDARTRLDVERVFDRTDVVLTMLRGRLGATEDDLKTLRDRAESLRESPRTTGSAAATQEAFRELCADILAAMDAMQ